MPGRWGADRPVERPDETLLREFLGRAMPAAADPPGGADDPVALAPLAGDGSARRLYRARRARRDGQAGWTAIAVLNPLAPDRTHPDENEAFVAVGEHLRGRGVRVPAVYATDLDRGLLLLEDLGDQRLLDAHVSGQAGGLYEEAVDALVRMQDPAGPAFRPEISGQPAYDERFVGLHEAGYFLAEVARGLAGWDDPPGEIEAEQARIARRALSGPQVFMHRDFQSRNLMVLQPPGRADGLSHPGQTAAAVRGPRLAVIDFQGARMGPAEYDLAALLYDPYADLPPARREELATRYRAGAHAAGVPGIPGPDAPPEIEGAWRARYLANAADRLMQALGAFAKLGVRCGRPGFREHIPAGLARLEDVLDRMGDAPALLALARWIAGRVGDER